MNTKRFLALLLALTLVLGLCACGDTPVQDTPNDDPVDPPAAESTDDPTDEPTDEPTDNPNPIYTVKIVDEGGNPVVGAMVQMCQGETCMPGPLSDANGTVTFQVVEADYKVSFLGSVPAGYDYTTEETEFYFEDGSYELTIVLKAIG